MKRILAVVVLVLSLQCVLAASSAQIISAGNMLELREPLGNVKATFTSADLDGLRSGTVTTALGSATYTQTLTLGNTTNGLQRAAVNYAPDEASGLMGAYLVVDTALPFFEWNITFSPSLNANATLLSTGAYRLTDYEGVKFPILGVNYTIVLATLQNATASPLTLFLARSDPVMDSLVVGQRRVYTVNGTTYDVTAVSANTTAATFTINAITGAVSLGADTAIGTVAVVLRETNETNVTFALFAPTSYLKISDANTTSASDFTTESVKIAFAAISDADAVLAGVPASGNGTDPTGYNLTTIRYHLLMDGLTSATAYAPIGYGVKSQMNRPQALLGTLDIMNNGFSAPLTTDLKLYGTGQSYALAFNNTLGPQYISKLIANASNALRYLSTSGDDFIFVEALTNVSYNININDTFVVSSAGASHIIRYRDYNNVTDEADIEDLSEGSMLHYPVSNSTGVVIIGGHTYNLVLENWNGSSPHRLAVDQNGDGSFNGAKVNVTIYGGATLDLASRFLNATGGATAPTSLNDVIGDDKNVTNATTTWTNGPATGVQMQLRTPAANFQTQNGDELLNWTISFTSNGLDLALATANYRGPLTNSLNAWSKYLLNFGDGVNSPKVGMTDLGALLQYSVGASGAASNLTIAYPSSQRNASVSVFVPLASALSALIVPPTLTMSVNNGTAIYAGTWGFNLSYSSDATLINYTIRNATSVWSNGTLRTRYLATDPVVVNSSVFNGLYLPSGNWTVMASAYSSSSTPTVVLANVTSYPSITATIVGANAQSATIGSSDISFRFLVTTKGAGSVVKAYVTLLNSQLRYNSYYAKLYNGSANVSVSGYSDYSGAGNFTLAPIALAAVPSYVALNLANEGIYQQTLFLTLTPYPGLSAGTYTGTYGFGVFG